MLQSAIAVADIGFGVEIELVGLDSERAAQLVVEHLGCMFDSHGREWLVVSDVSVPDGFELRSPRLTAGDLPLLEKIFRTLCLAGARSAPGRTGVHVHIDAGMFAPGSLRNLVLLWTNAEATLRHLYGVHPRRSLLFCRAVVPFAQLVDREASFNGAELHEIWTSDWVAGTDKSRRHHALNLDSLSTHGTIEVRLFESTHHPDELGAAVLTVVGLATQALVKRIATRIAPAPSPRTRADALQALRRLVDLLVLPQIARHHVMVVLRRRVMANH